MGGRDVRTPPSPRPGRVPWHESDDFWLAMAPFFFDAEHWERAPGEAAQALELAGLGTGGRAREKAVLDLACGTGRHSLELARLGLRVTGVDRTEAFVREARGRARDGGLAAEFTRDDMRGFCRARSFDCVLSLSTSFGYFEDPGDDRAVLVNAFRSLRPGGALLVQMMGREKASREFRGADADGERVRSPDGSVCIVKPLAERPAAGRGAWFEKRRVVVAPDVDGALTTRCEFEVSHRLYSADELARLLEECGFCAVGIYGDLAGGPHVPASSELVAVARRPCPETG